MTSINYTLISCELSNPPKMSPKCIRNSTVQYEVLTMCFIKRTLLNVSTKSREKQVLLLLLSSLQTVQAVACASHFFGEHLRGSSNSYASSVLSKLPMCSISRHTRTDT